MLSRAPTRAVAPTTMPVTHAVTHAVTQTTMKKEEKGGWTCPAWEHVNTASASECAVCQTARNPVRKTKVVNKVRMAGDYHAAETRVAQREDGGDGCEEGGDQGGDQRGDQGDQAGG